MGRLRALIFTFTCLFAIGSYCGAEPTIVVKSKETSQSGFASLLVRAFSGRNEFMGLAGGAEVSLDRRLVGRAPWSLDKLEPGTWLISVQVPGYRANEISLKVEGKKDYEVIFNLEQERGFVYVEVTPPDADIIVGGQVRKPGLIELPAGLQELRARRFGYRDATILVTISDRSTSRTRIDLEAAPFAVTDFGLSRQAFNPGNAGPLGLLRISFSVSSFGSGAIEIVDERNTSVFLRKFPSFKTWNQALSWDGRDSSGGALPDGRYEIRLRAGGAEGTAKEQSREVIIDSTTVARPHGSGGGLVGLVFLPEAGAPPSGLGTLDVGVSSEVSTGTTSVAMSGSWTGDYLLYGLTAKSDFGSATTIGAGIDGGLILPLASTYLGNWAIFDYALGSSFSASVAPTGSWSLGGTLIAPLALHIPQHTEATDPLLSFGLAPGGFLSWNQVLGGLGLGFELRSGLSLATSFWLFGVSARTSVAGLEALAPTWSGIEGAIEGRLTLVPSPLTLFLSLSGAMRATGRFDSPQLGGGLGLWF